MTDRFDEMAQAWGEDGCTLWRRDSCDRFPNGCPECPAQFADGVAALLRRVDTEAEERGRREEGQPLQSTDVLIQWGDAPPVRMSQQQHKERPGTNGRLPPGVDRVGIAFDAQPGRIFWTICGWKDGDPPDQKWIIDCGELVIPGLSHDPSEKKLD